MGNSICLLLNAGSVGPFMEQMRSVSDTLLVELTVIVYCV